MIKKRIISLITIVLFGILVCCLPVMADGSFSWSQDANRSKAEVTYYGNVKWLDKGIAALVTVTTDLSFPYNLAKNV